LFSRRTLCGALSERRNMSSRKYEFSWDIIGDLEAGRPNLGENVNIILYRLMQYILDPVKH